MATYIGVDVGKKSLQVYLPTVGRSFEVTNNESGFIKLIDSLCKSYDHLDNLIIVFEPVISPFIVSSISRGYVDR